MNRFLKRPAPVSSSSSSSSAAKRVKTSAKPGKISAAQRVREYGKGKFNESGSKLFCCACNVVVDIIYSHYI